RGRAVEGIGAGKNGPANEDYAAEGEQQQRANRSSKAEEEESADVEDRRKLAASHQVQAARQVADDDAIFAGLSDVDVMPSELATEFSGPVRKATSEHPPVRVGELDQYLVLGAAGDTLLDQLDRRLQAVSLKMEGDAVAVLGRSRGKLGFEATGRLEPDRRRKSEKDEARRRGIDRAETDGARADDANFPGANFPGANFPGASHLSSACSRRCGRC